MPKTKQQLLVVDDERIIRQALAERLEEAGYDVLTAEGLAAARRALADPASHVDALLLDIHLKDGDGLALLEEVRKARPGLPVIMATAYGDSERTIRAMSLGAFEYVTKPFDLDALLRVVARAVAPRQVTTREPEVRPPSGLVGTSARMLDVWKAIGRAAASDVPVLITGETGTGKELVARAIHEHGPRSARPFVAVNLAAIPETLVESELFGHEKGAFTGASARREGRFELAADGTLFLDEIADLRLPLQTKLLRVLEDGGFERVGGSTRLVSRARILSATSQAVDPDAPGTTLREDLFYRLGVLRIEVPPLRERREDIPLLVRAFLEGDRPGRAVSDAAMAKLCAHAWPGNVRELRHVLSSACVMSPADVIDEADLALRVESPQTQAKAGPRDLDLRKAVDELERSMIVEALARAGGNRTEAARLLGIRRALLYARLKQLGIEGDEGES